jgi:hypothetical protein
MIRILGMIVAVALIILCTLLPFLPGRYDSLAATVSMMARTFGVVGLLLVPVGVLWTTSTYWRPLERAQHSLAVTALVVSTFVGLLVLLPVLLESVTLWIAAITAGGWLVARAWHRLRTSRGTTSAPSPVMPLSLVIVPIAVVVIQVAMADRVAAFSRARAIRNSAPLIADIERYRAANGRYPASLVSLWPDYLPAVIGIKEYRYEPHGDAYNLVFEQPSFVFGTREIVVYNPIDRQVMTSHANDILRLTPDQLALERTRGHYAVRDAPHAHWKYFLFD